MPDAKVSSDFFNSLKNKIGSFVGPLAPNTTPLNPNDPLVKQKREQGWPDKKIQAWLTNAGHQAQVKAQNKNIDNLEATLQSADLRRKRELKGDKIESPKTTDSNNKTDSNNTKNYEAAAGFGNLGINTNQARALAWLNWFDQMESEEEKKKVADNLGFNYDQFEQDYGDLFSDIQANQGGGDTESVIGENLRDELNSLYTDYGGDILTVDTDNYKSKNQAYNTEANYAQDYYTVGIDVTGDGQADFNLLAYETEAGQLEDNLKTNEGAGLIPQASDNFKQTWKEEAQANDLGKYMDTGNTKYYDTSRNNLLTEQAMRNKMLDEFKDAFNESIDLNDFTTGDSEGNVSSYKNLTGSSAVNQLLLDVLDGKQGFKGLFDRGNALDESIGASGLQTFLLSGNNENNGLEEDLTIQDTSDDGETTDYTIEKSTPTELRNQISGQQMYDRTKDMSKEELVKGLGTTVVPQQTVGEIKNARKAYGSTANGSLEIYPSEYGDIKHINNGNGDEYVYVDGETANRPDAEQMFQKAKRDFTDGDSSDGLIILQDETPNAYDEMSMLVNKFLEEGSRGEFDITQKNYNADANVKSSADLATKGTDATPEAGYQNAGFYGYSNRDDDFSKDKSSAPSVQETFGSYNSLPTSSPQENAADHAKQAQLYANKMMGKIQAYGDRDNNTVYSAYDFKRNNNTRSPKAYNIAVPVIQDTTTDTSAEEGEE